VSIRERVLDHLAHAYNPPMVGDTLDMGEVFYYVGGRSWPTFCREIYRMEREGLIFVNHWSEEENYIGLGVEP
jgi:hypothetical protein